MQGQERIQFALIGFGRNQPMNHPILAEGYSFPADAWALGWQPGLPPRNSHAGNSRCLYPGDFSGKFSPASNSGKPCRYLVDSLQVPCRYLTNTVLRRSCFRNEFDKVECSGPVAGLSIYMLIFRHNPFLDTRGFVDETSLPLARTAVVLGTFFSSIPSQTD